MYRMLVLTGVSALALMTLVVSAQQPLPDIGKSNDQAPSDPFQLPHAPRLEMFQGNMSPYHLFGGRAHREEIELAQKSEELVKQLAKAEGDNKEKIRTQLNETLGKQFDARQKRHNAEIKALEDKVKKLKDLVQKRQDNRREIISKRIDQLQRDAEGLGW